MGKHTRNLLTKDKQKYALKLIHNKNKLYHSKELSESCKVFDVYKPNLPNTVVFMHKTKNRTAPSLSLKNLRNLLIRIRHDFQVEITGNHKLNYANIDLEFPLGIEQYGTTYSEVRKKKFSRFFFLKLT